MTDQPDAEAARVHAVILAAHEHVRYARTLLHNLVNSVAVPASLPITAIAAEQSAEMELRHADREIDDVERYWPLAAPVRIGGAA